MHGSPCKVRGAAPDRLAGWLAAHPPSLDAPVQGPVFDSDARRSHGPVLVWVDKLLAYPAEATKPVCVCASVCLWVCERTLHMQPRGSMCRVR